MLKDTLFYQKHTLNCGGKIINLSSALVMGIINITPDSFYGGSRFNNEDDILKQVEKMLSEGADIIDIGAASSRPGAKLISPEDEQKVILPALKSVVKKFPQAIISVDTYNSDTAIKSVESGAHIINDISSGDIDVKMFDVIASLNVPYIMMHMQGTPENMQTEPKYNNIIKEISLYFAEKINKLRLMGVNDIIIDPGFGFGKTLENNYELLSKLDYFKIFDCPMLVGLSRKSMINKVLNTKPDEALNGTTVLNTIALMKDAKILRVHDVKEAKQAIMLVEGFGYKGIRV
ncbi:MAG: dihydropteroate synthase [Bacteroidetes bacterium]|nr:dihydropteroate synthase [Bacteroidota bacterium]